MYKEPSLRGSYFYRPPRDARQSLGCNENESSCTRPSFDGHGHCSNLLCGDGKIGDLSGEKEKLELLMLL